MDERTLLVVSLEMANRGVGSGVFDRGAPLGGIGWPAGLCGSAGCGVVDLLRGVKTCSKNNLKEPAIGL